MVARCVVVLAECVAKTLVEVGQSQPHLGPALAHVDQASTLQAVAETRYQLWSRTANQESLKSDDDAEQGFHITNPYPSDLVFISEHVDSIARRRAERTLPEGRENRS